MHQACVCGFMAFCALFLLAGLVDQDCSHFTDAEAKPQHTKRALNKALMLHQKMVDKEVADHGQLKLTEFGKCSKFFSHHIFSSTVQRTKLPLTQFVLTVGNTH